MSLTKTWSKRLFLEPLEDRLCPSVADPAIAFVAHPTGIYNLTVMNGDGSNQAVIWSRSSLIAKSSWSPQSGTSGPFQGSLVVETENPSGPLPIFTDRKSTRLNSSHIQKSRMPSSA